MHNPSLVAAVDFSALQIDSPMSFRGAFLCNGGLSAKLFR